MRIIEEVLMWYTYKVNFGKTSHGSWQAALENRQH
jgi:hypothetical protein